MTVEQDVGKVLAGSHCCVVNGLLWRALNDKDWPPRQDFSERYHQFDIEKIILNSNCASKTQREKLWTECRAFVMRTIADHESWLRCQPELYGMMTWALRDAAPRFLSSRLLREDVADEDLGVLACLPGCLRGKIAHYVSLIDDSESDSASDY